MRLCKNFYLYVEVFGYKLFQALSGNTVHNLFRACYSLDHRISLPWTYHQSNICYLLFHYIFTYFHYFDRTLATFLYKGGECGKAEKEKIIDFENSPYRHFFVLCHSAKVGWKYAFILWDLWRWFVKNWKYWIFFLYFPSNWESAKLQRLAFACLR